MYTLRKRIGKFELVSRFEAVKLNTTNLGTYSLAAANARPGKIFRVPCGIDALDATMASVRAPPQSPRRRLFGHADT